MSTHAGNAVVFRSPILLHTKSTGGGVYGVDEEPTAIVMKKIRTGNRSPQDRSISARWAFLIFAGAVIVIVAGHFLKLATKEPQPVGAASGTGPRSEAPAN